jgi:hypothetical protein
MFYLLLQWKPLNATTLEQTDSDYINQMITLSECIDTYSKWVNWDLSLLSYKPNDNINPDHIKRLPLYL